MSNHSKQYFDFLKEERVPRPFCFNCCEEILKIMIKYERISKDEVRQGDMNALRKARFELTKVAKNFGKIDSWCELTEGGSWGLVEKKYVKDREFRAFCRKVSDIYYCYAEEVFRWQKALKEVVSE